MQKIYARRPNTSRREPKEQQKNREGKCGPRATAADFASAKKKEAARRQKRAAGCSMNRDREWTPNAGATMIVQSVRKPELLTLEEAGCVHGLFMQHYTGRFIKAAWVV